MISRERSLFNSHSQGDGTAGKGPLPDLNKVLGQSDKPPAPVAGAQSGEPPLKPVSIPEEKPVQIADSAQDMVPERCVRRVAYQCFIAGTKAFPNHSKSLSLLSQAMLISALRIICKLAPVLH